MAVIRFSIRGEPVPKGAVKHFFTKGRMHGYLKKETREGMENVRAQIVQQLPKDFVPFDAPLRAVVRFIRAPPKCRRKKNLRPEDLYPGRRPDLDNYLKLLWDACNGVIFTDDARIVELDAAKKFGDVQGIEVMVGELE